LEIATLAWVDVTHNSAYALRVAQTPTAPSRDAEQTRIDTYMAHIAGVVTTQHLQLLKYLVVDGYFSKQKFVDGIRVLDMHLVGKLRRDANLRHLCHGPRHCGPGRPKIYAGKVPCSDLARFEHVESGDEDMARSPIRGSITCTSSVICASCWCATDLLGAMPSSLAQT